ncbi:UDP-glucuronate 5-epimerase [Hyphomonas beringensis]|uniref:UDP-glucuronate 5-epimerase n=1 Tax=Hyphomonas beringensis TaxID=1280946 RepID=A0A062U4Q3_9PROT|nr:NAD-dependent epimerase/dehydratase family protein [Hyphomonas beringensis]KCZ53262.1 UDP-glucuronate 5-epimerase [Hyphomonas beringensis]
MKILVTGAAGFIGSELALRLLKEGHQVAGVDCYTPYYDVQLKHDRVARLTPFDTFKMHKIRVEDEDAMTAVFDSFQPEIVVHFAAQAGVRYSLDHPREYIAANIVGSFNVIELSRLKGVKHLVMASTSSAYGANQKFPFEETDAAPHPLTIYAATKLSSEMIAHSHSHLYGTPTTLLRFFSVYGPWGRPDMAFFLFTDKIFKGEPIDVFNHGDLKRDFTYIDDLVESIRRLMDHPPIAGEPVSRGDSLSPLAPYRLVNIGNATPVRLMDYIEAIEDAIGKTAIKNMLPMQPGDVKQTYADVSLLKAITDYTPTTDVRTGVKAFVDWYRDYFKPE